MIPLPDFLQYLMTVIGLCVIIGGGFFAFKNGKVNALVKGQKDTIDLLEQRTKALEGKISDLEKQNAVQQHIIDTITSALEQEGRYITINGDMVTISDKEGGRSIHRKRTTITQSATISKKEEV